LFSSGGGGGGGGGASAAFLAGARVQISKVKEVSIFDLTLLN